MYLCRSGIIRQQNILYKYIAYDICWNCILIVCSWLKDNEVHNNGYVSHRFIFVTCICLIVRDKANGMFDDSKLQHNYMSRNVYI